MSVCSGAGFVKMNVHWVKTEMFDKANYLIDNYPLIKTSSIGIQKIIH